MNSIAIITISIFVLLHNKHGKQNTFTCAKALIKRVCLAGCEHATCAKTTTCFHNSCITQQIRTHPKIGKGSDYLLFEPLAQNRYFLNKPEVYRAPPESLSLTAKNYLYVKLFIYQLHRVLAEWEAQKTQREKN